LDEVANTQIRSKGRIKRPTALLIDKSQSMTEAIEVGKQIGTVVSAVMDAPLYVYAFDSMPYPVKATGTELAQWEAALKGIRAGGNTSCGCAVKALEVQKQKVEQIIIVTDEDENAAPSFVDALRSYTRSLQCDMPHVVVVKTRSANGKLTNSLTAAGIQHDGWSFTGDYYSLVNLVPLLSRPSRLDLLMEIMSYPVPQRKAS